MVTPADGAAMTIVAAVDRSSRAPAAVAEAVELAAAYGDDVHVVHVLNRADFLELERTSVDDTGQPVPMDRVRDVAREIAEETIEEAVADAEAIGLVGDPADEVLRHADEQDARFVVLAGRKRSPVGKAVFGSVAQDILLGADRPVVTVMADEES